MISPSHGTADAPVSIPRADASRQNDNAFMESKARDEGGEIYDTATSFM
jgi:hypothetical protein